MENERQDRTAHIKIKASEILKLSKTEFTVDYADGTSHKVNEGVLLEATPEGRMIFHNGTDRVSVLFASTFALFEAIARFGLTEAYDEYFRREMEIKHKEETDENGNQ